MTPVRHFPRKIAQNTDFDFTGFGKSNCWNRYACRKYEKYRTYLPRAVKGLLTRHASFPSFGTIFLCKTITRSLATQSMVPEELIRGGGADIFVRVFSPSISAPFGEVRSSWEAAANDS